MFPIRCVVECVNESECVKCSDRGTTIADSFAIVAGQTPLSQLVETVLTALGLQHLSLGAKAWIQLKNWKPLSFNQITDDPDLEIDHLLKDVSNQLTLRILTKQADVAMLDCVRDMKDRLLKVMLQKTPKLLQEASAFNPYLKELIVQLAQGDATPTLIDADQIHQFNAWLEQFASSEMASTAPGKSYNSGGISNGVIVHSSISHSQRNGPCASSYAAGSSTDNHTLRHSSFGNHASGGVNHSTPGATRFSPLLEVPKLERWFRENPNPTRQKLQYYMQILNGSNFRKHAGKITYQQICNWFINARASQRKKDGGDGGGIRSSSKRASDSVLIDQSGTSSSSSLLAADGRPNSSGSVGAGVVGTPANHWVSKVFSNNVRNLSIAFNDFIQSTPPKLAKSDGVVALHVPGGESPPSASASVAALANSNQSQNQVRANTPSLETSSTSSASPTSRPRTGSRDVTINVIRDDGLPVVYREEEDEDGEMRMRIVENSIDDATAAGRTVSPTVTVGAVLKASMNDGLPTMAAPSRLTNANSGTNSTNNISSASNAAVNRTRLMFDPLTELPMLEKWFEENPHPSWAQVDQYTEQLNSLSYRQTYPPVSAHNLKIWFKNRRAKCKRLMSGNGANGDGALSAITIKSEST